MKPFMNRDGLLILADYDRYADNLLLETVDKLTEDEFARQSSPSHGSVRKLILHSLETLAVFLALCREQPLQELPDLPTLLDIRRHSETIRQEVRKWIESSNDNELRREIPFPIPLKGKSLCLAKWQMLLQAFEHSAQHRSELSVVLSELGHPLPNLDIILQWVEE